MTTLNIGGNNDWRLPTAAELEPLMKKELIINLGGAYYERLDFTNFIWTNVKEVTMAPLRAGYGRVGPFPTGKDAYVYAVKGGDPSLLADFRKKADEIFSAEKAQVRKEEIERKKQEAIYAEDQKKFQQALNNKSPQSMYLAAGAYARNGDRSRASEIYEKIISRFPKNNWAVKASDQLSDFRRADENRRNSQSSQNQQKSSNGGYRITQTYMNKDPMEVHGECYDGTTLTGHRYYSDEYWTIVGKTSVQNKYYSLEQSLSAACP